jgi:GNAT superfamily N-acetyltransferase
MQTQPVDIVPAAPQDAQLICDLIRELAEYEKLAHEAVATPAMITDALFGRRPWAEALIARADGEAAGFALYFHNFSTFLARPGLYLEDLFVRPRYRGRGIGKAFLARLAHIAVERGCGRFEWAVLDWNTPARKFYESLGARPISEWIVHRVAGDALTALALSD